MKVIDIYYDCGHGCLPIRMTLPVDEEPCPAGHLPHIVETEAGHRLLEMGVRVHMKCHS